MSGGGFERAAGRLRAAIQAGEFGPALAVVPEFRRELDAALADLPRGGPAALAVAEQARDLLEWARRSALCGQSHVAAQLEALACVNAYTGARRERGCWEVEG